jgi:hypothetical protein
VNRRRKVASIAFTGAAATLTAGMVTAHADAATVSWHIKNDGKPYHGPVKGHNKPGTKAEMKDTTTGVVLTCSTVTAAGSVPKSNVPATTASPAVAVIKTASFTHCLLGGTIAFTAKIAKLGDLRAQTYDATTGVTKGYLGTKGTIISGVLTGVGNNCHATLTGSTLPGSAHNTTHSIVVNPLHAVTLHVKSARSCGLLHTGDKAWASGKAVASVPTALTISKK